jgi:hypothetical protein
MTTVLRTSGLELGNSIMDVSGSAESFPCRAWVTFNGTNNTIYADENVSTISDNGNSIWTVNFSTALPSANYCTSAICNQANTNWFYEVMLNGSSLVQTSSGTQIIVRRDGDQAVTEVSLISVVCTMN